MRIIDKGQLLGFYCRYRHQIGSASATLMHHKKERRVFAQLQEYPEKNPFMM